MSEERKKIKGVLLDTVENKAEIIEFVPILDNYYKLLHCDKIEYATRKIGAGNRLKEFDIVCDEEGKFKEDNKISAIDNLGRPMLVGSLLVVGPADDEGDETSLSDGDCEYVMERIQKMNTMKYPLGYLMLTQCEY